jgi:signal transduction histidine kinase
MQTFDNLTIIIVALLIIILGVSGFIGYSMQRLIRAQREEAGRLNAILNSIADGVIVQGLTGDIETMNPSAQKIIEIISRDVPTKKDTQHLQAQAEARVSSLLNYLAGLDYYEPQNIEVGGRVLGTRSAPVVTSAGEQFGAVFVLRDITSEVEAKKLKDDFITTVSHELRTPLAVIKGYNDLIRMNVKVVPSEYRANFIKSLDSVDEHILHLLHLIEQMLDITQINAGTLGIDHEDINLTEMIKTEVNRWQDNMAARNLSYHLELPDKTLWVKGDEDRLSRVLYNLIKNAHNYTLPGGRVEIKVQTLLDQVQVNVIDTGVGISEHDQPFIFSRFFRAIHAEHTFDVSGAGLGLFLSRAIIQAHQGQIWFESRINQGSTFSFTLPLLNSERDNDFIGHKNIVDEPVF